MKFSLILAALTGAVASSATNAPPPPQSQLQLPVKKPFNDDLPGNRNLPPVPPPNNLPGNQNLPTLNQNFPLKPFQGKLTVNLPSNQRSKFGSAPAVNVPNHLNQDSFQRNQPSIEFSNGPSFNSQSFAPQNKQSQNFNFEKSPAFGPNRELAGSMSSFANQRTNIFKSQGQKSRFQIQQSSPDFKFDWRFRAQSADDRRYPQSRQSLSNFDNDFREPRFFDNDFKNNFDNRFNQNNFNDRQFGSRPRSFSSDSYKSRDRFGERPRFEPKQSQSFDNQNYPRPTQSFEKDQRTQPERFQQFNQQNSYSSNYMRGFNPRTQTSRQDFFNPSQFDRSDRQSFSSTPSNRPSSSSQMPNRFDFYPSQQSSKRSPFFFYNDNSDFGFPRFNMMKSGKDFGPNEIKKDKTPSFSFQGQSQQFQQTQPKPQSQHQPQVQPPHQSPPQTQPKPQFPSRPQPNQQQTPNIPPPKK